MYSAMLISVEWNIHGSCTFRITYLITKPYDNECQKYATFDTLHTAVSIVCSLSPMLYEGITP